MRLSPANVALTLLGGTIGSLWRVFVGTFNDEISTLFIVNVIGCLIVGWINADPRLTGERARAFWSVGFCGGLTSLSAVAVWFAFPFEASTGVLTHQPFAIISGAWILLMIVDGIVAYFVGAWLARRFVAGAGLPPIEPEPFGEIDETPKTNKDGGR